MEAASSVRLYWGLGLEDEVQTDHVVNSDSNKLVTCLLNPPATSLCQILEQFWCLLQLDIFDRNGDSKKTR